jgi:hypothetical protein
MPSLYVARSFGGRGTGGIWGVVVVVVSPHRATVTTVRWRPRALGSRALSHTTRSR